MKTYNPEGMCPKCGNDLVYSAYHSTWEYRCPCSQGTEEHICRKCNRCGFRWCEAVLDEPPKTVGDYIEVQKEVK